MTKREYTKRFKDELTHQLDLLCASKSKWSGDTINIDCKAECEKLGEFKRLTGYKILWFDWLDSQTINFTVQVC